MAECQLPKLNTRVRFPSPAPCKKPRKVLIFKNFSGFLYFPEGAIKIDYTGVPVCSLLGQPLGQLLLQIRPQKLPRGAHLLTRSKNNLNILAFIIDFI